MHVKNTGITTSVIWDVKNRATLRAPNGHTRRLTSATKWARPVDIIDVVSKSLLGHPAHEPKEAVRPLGPRNPVQPAPAPPTPPSPPPPSLPTRTTSYCFSGCSPSRTCNLADGGGGRVRRRGKWPPTSAAAAAACVLLLRGVRQDGRNLEDRVVPRVLLPPDLREVLREGLPIGTGFPNWRSASPEQLQLLICLPTSDLLHEVSWGRFWCESAWGSKPHGAAEALRVAESVMETAPLLVPIYQHFYMPSRPNMAGNPVFFVRGGEVRRSNGNWGEAAPSPPDSAPAWASTSPRPIDVWTQLAEGGRVIRRPERTASTVTTPQLRKLLEHLEWKLREGGWTNREAREMMSAGVSEQSSSGQPSPVDAYSLAGHVRALAVALLQAGWSQGDVAYSLGDVSVNPQRRNDASMEQ
ncbi:unnamed protein product [Spirodela intermedia]|uniref:Uncharacterized protein n=1 Tax=Spirodela intermedia TaxID=51605 RepID=A0A7I8IJG8_SPIIN|nr:unnamed protein product [Spirodela intermedia]CAA6657640.1 unnamed protein product [Spirodela intermedia]